MNVKLVSFLWFAIALSFASQQARASKPLEAQNIRLHPVFEANEGQTDPRVKFLARSGHAALFLGSRDVTLKLNATRTDVEVLKMSFHGALSAMRAEGIDPEPGTVNYFIGNDPARWRHGVHTFKKVQYSAVYPGIGVSFYANPDDLEYDIIAQPGADLTKVLLDLEGPTSLSITPNGDLLMKIGEATVTLRRPVAYQLDRGTRRTVSSQFRIRSPRQVGFELGSYDRDRGIVIDPVLAYSTFLGGSSGDLGAGIVADSSGNAFVVGYAGSVDFPTTTGAYQIKVAGAADFSISKLSQAGNSLVWSTLLGGSGQEWTGMAVDPFVTNGIAVDGSGNVYVVGDTSSLDFPMVNSFSNHCTDLSQGGCFTAVLAEISSDGSRLLYSTYLGGSIGGNGRSATHAVGVGVDGAGRAYVGGTTEDVDFPSTLGSYQPTVPATPYCGTPGFIAKFDTTQTGPASLLYSTYVYDAAVADTRGCNVEVASVAVDTSGKVFLAGRGQVPILGVGTGVEGGGFAAEFDLSKGGLTALIGSYGFGAVTPAAVATDGNGYAYVTGTTDSSSCGFWFGCTLGGFQPTSSALPAGFVVKLSLATSGGTGYFSYMGGDSPKSYGTSIAADSAGNAYVVGYVASPAGINLPLVAPIQSGPAPGDTAVVMKVNSTGTTLLFSSFLGGNQAVLLPTSVATDGSENMYLTGYAAIMPTVSAFQPVSLAVGTSDPFVAKISGADGPGIAFQPSLQVRASRLIAAARHQPFPLPQVARSLSLSTPSLRDLSMAL